MRNQIHGLSLSLLTAVLWMCNPSLTVSAQVDGPSEVQVPEGQRPSDNATVAPRVRVAAKDPKPTYRVDLKLYSIRLGQSPADIQYYSDGAALVAGRKKIEEILKELVGVVFDEIHLRDICDFIAKTYEINLILDNRVIRPRKAKDPGGAADPPDTAYVTDGIISYVNLKNVSLKQTLQAILRPLGLDYSVESSFIWISTPEKIASESFGFFYRPSSIFTFHQEGAYVFHDEETVLLGKPELRWSGRSEPAIRSIVRLASSTLIAREGQYAEIRVGDSTPIQYFEPLKTEAGVAFRLRTSDEKTGFTASVIVSSLEDPQEVDVQLSVSVGIVGERSPLDGVFLNVGKPSVVRSEHSDTHRTPLGKWASLLGSADTNSALLLLLKVSPAGDSPEGAVEHASQTDIEEEATQYVVEVKFVRYRGRLNEERLKSKVAGSDARRVALNAFRLLDGILPLRRKDVDFTDPKTLIGIPKLRGFELMSAPRITIFGNKSWAGENTKDKLVFKSDSPLAEMDFERAIRILTPENDHLQISIDHLTGRRLLVQSMTNTETRDVNGTTVEETKFYEANTEILLALGVDDSNEAGPPMLVIYSQVRVKKGWLNGIAKNRDDASAGLSFIDYQDRIEIREGEWVVYLASPSKEEHYLTLISVKKKSSER